MIDIPPFTGMFDCMRTMRKTAAIITELMLSVEWTPRFPNYWVMNGNGPRWARTTLAPIRLTNAAAQLPYGSGETKGEASPPRIRTAPVPTAEASRTRLLVEHNKAEAESMLQQWKTQASPAHIHTTPPLNCGGTATEPLQTTNDTTHNTTIMYRDEP